MRMLGWLNLPYVSEFFGQDVLHDGAGDPHVFLANYQTVGFVDREHQVELRPKRDTRVQGDAEAAGRAHALREAIAFYQVAARRFGEQAPH